MRSKMRIHHEPLVHFLALGAALFLLFRLVGDKEARGAGRIEVGAAQVELLAAGFARTWQRPPTAAELEGLIEKHVREEVYYREALAMGLDRDDIIVRRRLSQKLEFVADDYLGVLDPTEDELRRYLEDHAETFRVPARLSFDHVYLNRDRRGDNAARRAELLLSRLNGSGSTAHPAILGDPSLLPSSFERVSERSVARQFGTKFSARLVGLPVGRWAGPVESAYGLHVVRIREREKGVDPTLNEVRETVEREWRAARREEAAEAFYQSLRARYSIVVERPGVTEGEAEDVEVAEVRR